MSANRVRRGRLALLTAGAAAGALVLAGCGGGDDAGASKGNTQFVQGTGEIAKVAEGKRQPAPDISGQSVDGHPVKLSDYKGKIVVLNVWGSWCAPCRAEAPHMAKVAEQTKSKGVQFLGINTRDYDKANARAFERSYKIGYPSLFDPDGKQILKFPGSSLPPQTIPSTLVLDRDHKIAVRALKELDSDELHAALDPLIAKK